jgi:Tol biopolymer transport system component
MQRQHNSGRAGALARAALTTRRRRVLALLLAAVVAGSALAVLPTSADDNDLLLVSRNAAGAPNVREATQPSMSADGRLVAFTSKAKLSPDDQDAAEDVFVRDVATSSTALLSRASGAAGAPGDGTSYGPSMSADGRFVAFESDADSLTGNDQPGVTDVYVRDLQDNTTTLVSRAGGATGAPGNGHSHDPAISADGDWVAFESAATNLTGGDTNGRDDVFVRNLRDGRTLLVSSAPTGSGDGDSWSAAISGDGRYVAFESRAQNLAALDTPGTPGWSVFRRDMRTGATALVSRATGASGAAADQDSFAPSISADGRRVAFESLGRNVSGEDADFSENGQTLVDDVYVRDLSSSTTRFVSRAQGPSGAAGNRGSMAPAISADGHFVAFESGAENIAGGGASGTVDVFVRDLDTGSVRLLSRAGSDGPAGADHSAYAAISAGGRFVAFESLATNLVDAAAGPSVYRRDVLGGPSGTDPVAPPSVVTVVPSGETGPVDMGTPQLPAPTPDTRRPRLTLRGIPRGCIRRRFRVRARVVDESPLRTASLRLDRRTLRTARTGRLSAVVRAGRLRRGRHRVALRAADVAGNSAVKTKAFRSCKPRARR